MELLGNYNEDYKLPIIMDEMDIINTYEPDVGEEILEELISITMDVDLPTSTEDLPTSTEDLSTSVILCIVNIAAFRCLKCSNVARYGYITDKIPTHCHKCRDIYQVIMDGFCKCGNICTFGPSSNEIRNTCLYCKRNNHISKPLYHCYCGRIATYISKPTIGNPQVYACSVHSGLNWIRIVGRPKCECGKIAEYGYIYGFPATCFDCSTYDQNRVVRE